MKTTTISKKTSLIIAHGILWCSAIIATGIVLATGSPASIIFSILTMNAVVSILILGYELKDK